MTAQALQGDALRIGDSTPGAVADAADYPETALPVTERAKAAFSGVVIALVAGAICLVAALLIVAGPFHTSPGSIA